MSARLAIMRAARQLALEADVHISVRNFSIINQATPCSNLASEASRSEVVVSAQVGAVSIDARLNCDAFANTHSATSHYDRQSFVGLAWRPEGESICCGENYPLCNLTLCILR